MSASDDTTNAVAEALARIRLEYGECLMKGLRCEISTHDARLLMQHIDQCEAQSAHKTVRIGDLEAKLAAVTRERDEARELLANRVWAEAENDPEFVKAATRGKADIEAGRTVQWTPEDNANNRA